MKKLIKPFLIILVCLLVVFAFSMAYGFIKAIPEDIIILPGDTTSYRFQTGIQMFCKLLFATLATGVATGFSWAFATEADPKKHLDKTFMLPQLRNVLIVVTVCTLLFVVSADLIQPVAEIKKGTLEKNADNFQQYTVLAKDYAEKEDYIRAYSYAKAAYDLNQEDSDAKELFRNLELAVASLEEDEDEEPEKLTESLDYLKQAQDYFDREDYLNAHYFATLAEKNSPRDDQTLKVAKELAANSWNMLYDYSKGVDKDTVVLYATKEDAYRLFSNGDILQAYYAFKQLHEDCPQDDEIKNYYEKAQDLLESSFFYTDETDGMRSLETFNNVSFSVQNDTDGTDYFTISGITVVGKSGMLVQYLRNLEIVSTDAAGKTLSHLCVPYAKMTAQSVTLDGRNVKYQPFLLLESVNKNAENESLHVKPYWVEEDGSISTEEPPSYLLLDMPYDDFTLIRQASSGPDLMPLISLFKFAPKADIYGYSSNAFMTKFILRLTLPLFVLSLLLYMAVIGWGLRLEPDQPFKTRWILMFPLLAFVAYIAKDLLLYILNLLIYSLCQYVPALAMYITCGAALLAVFLTSIYFLSLQSE